MAFDPVLLGVKLVVLVVLAVALWILHGFLTPEQFRVAVGVAIAAFVVSLFAIWAVAVRLLSNPRSRWARGMVLSHEARSTDGFTASTDLAGLVGSRGRTRSALRPSGVAVFDGRRISVVTEGEFVRSGAEVEVVLVHGARVVVRPAE